MYNYLTHECTKAKLQFWQKNTWNKVYEPYWLKQTGFMFWINWFIYHIWLKKLFIYESHIATSLMNMSRRDYHYELKKTNLIKCQIVFFGSAWQPRFFFIHIEKSSQDILKKQVRFSKKWQNLWFNFHNVHKPHATFIEWWPPQTHKRSAPSPSMPSVSRPGVRCADCLSNPATRPGRSIIADSWRPGSRSVMMIK